MRTLHVISSLGPGGAERAMANVVIRLRDRGQDAAVVSVGGGGRIGDELVAAGIPVHTLGVGGPISVHRGVQRLRQIAATWQPRVMQAWMYHANLLAGIARVPGVPLVFGIRHSLPTMSEERPLTRIVIRLGAVLSGRAQAIVYNTKSSIPQHERIGYASGRGIWIPNGFDTGRFRPDTAQRARIRRELQIGEQTPLVGLVARFHPIKDQAMFLRAAAVVVSHLPQARFLLVGHGIDDSRNGLQGLASQLGITGQVRFLGDRSDVPAVINALDVACLTSRSEGFPNVLPEAMACGVPVVSTRVGDVLEIVGDDGLVVSPGDAQGIADGVLSSLGRSSQARQSATSRARERIVRDFSEGAMLDAFERLYLRLAN